MLTINPGKIKHGWLPYYINAFNYESGRMEPMLRMVYMPEEQFYLVNSKDKVIFFGREGDVVIWKMDPDEIHEKSDDLYPYYPCIGYIFNKKYIRLDKLKKQDVKKIMVEKWKKAMKEYPEILK